MKKKKKKKLFSLGFDSRFTTDYMEGVEYAYLLSGFQTEVFVGGGGGGGGGGTMRKCFPPPPSHTYRKKKKLF